MTSDTAKQPDDLKQDIDRTRAQLGETLQAIQHKLSLGRLLDQALDRLGGKATAGAADYIGSALPQNPLPVVLVGVGVSWLTLSHFNTVHSRTTAVSEADTGWSREQQRVLRLAGLGLVAGAALGALLPPTRREDQWVGDYRDRLLEQVHATGAEYRAKAQSVAAAAQDAAEAQMHRFSRAEGRERKSLYGAAGRIVEIPKAVLDAAAEEARQQGLIGLGEARKPS